MAQPTSWPETVGSAPVRAVSVQQMQRMDEAAIHAFHIPRLLLMEHAGQAVARAVLRVCAHPMTRPLRVLVCCGPGHNGGDGLCAAWHLAQDGHRVRVLVAGSLASLNEEPVVYARILRALEVEWIEIGAAAQVEGIRREFAQAEAIIDALLGIGLQGPVRPAIASLIEAINGARVPVVSVDIPSGLDGDTGLPHGVAVKATVTVAMALAKQGCVTTGARPYVGRLVVEDIGLPRRVMNP